MKATLLLQWQYLIYLLPLGVSALLLLLSTLRLGHRGGHGVRAHGGAVGHHGAAHAGAHALGKITHAGAHGVKIGGHTVKAQVGRVHVTRHGANKENVTLSTNLLLHITGADRAPWSMIAEAFCLVWGVCGYWANQYTVSALAEPTWKQMLPSLGIALGGGIIGARIGAEIIARVMPPDESQDVSQEGLYGLTGEVAFPVSETGGRIRIYDPHGSLHDETCRIAAGHAPIPKGRSAIVMDRDAQGNLIVEEISG